MQHVHLRKRKIMNRRHLLCLAPLTLTGSAFASERQLSPSESGGHVANVRSYGAIGDGKAVDSDAVNRAIEDLSRKGGGTLLFPPGVYACFTIHLKSNIEVYLSAGSTILAADSPRPHETTGYRNGVYDSAEPNEPWTPYQDYGHNHWRNSLFYAEAASDFSIVGPGLIFGKGLSNGSRGSRGGYDVFIAEQKGVGNKALAFKNCRNVLLRDFRILKGGHFALLATGCDNLSIDNLLIDTDRDGLDIDCCRNVRVSNCTINSPWDDAICPKSSYALGYARPTENVTISNNFVTGGYELGSVEAGTWRKLPDSTHVIREGRIKCGTESNGGFRNITITGNVIEACKGIALETSDGALLEDVAITCNTMREIVDAPLFLRLNRRDRNPKETIRPGSLRRIIISDLVSYDSASSTASIVAGIPENLIQDVKLSNCFFDHRGLPKEMRVGFGEEIKPMPDWRSVKVPELATAYPEPLHFGPTPVNGFYLRHLKNLEMSHVEIATAFPDPRPAFWLEDVHRADFFAITALRQPNFELHRVTDVRIKWSRACEDFEGVDIENKLL
jgi:polygalacturonase